MWAEAEASWRDLAGREVTRWRGVEMALREGGDGVPPGWDDPAIPFRQLFALDLEFAGGDRRSAGTYQDDADFGLLVRAGSWHDRHEWDGIYRACEPDLPVGRIDAVDVLAEADVVAEVTLTVGGHPVLLVAGEVEETMAGGLDLVRLDESVLVFVDPRAADALTWRPPRTLRPPRSPGDDPPHQPRLQVGETADRDP